MLGTASSPARLVSKQHLTPFARRAATKGSANGEGLHTAGRNADQAKMAVNAKKRTVNPR
jgi:hypothetical protein